MDAGIELLMNIRESNRIKPKDEDEYRYRLDKSFDVIMCFEKLWALLDLSERTLCIPVKTLGTCSDLLYKAETITVAWRRSDLKIDGYFMEMII